MNEFPIKQFRLKRGYTFAEPLAGDYLDKNNLIVGGHAEYKSLDAFFLGRLAEYENMKLNIWIDSNSAHAIYVMGKRRSGKSYTLGVIAESLISKQWFKQSENRQAVLLLDTMNVFLTMNYNVEGVYGNSSEEDNELKQWGMNSENLPIKFFYPKGTDKPTHGNSAEFSLKASDLSGEDLASLFGYDTYSEPVGQLISELYEKVTIEGYTTIQGEQISANSNYSIPDLLNCLINSSEVQRYESRTVEAVRRRLQALERLTIFSNEGLNIKEIFVKGQLSIVLLRDLDFNLRGLMIAIITKKIMELRSYSDRYEQLAEIYRFKKGSVKSGTPESEEVYNQYDQYINESLKGLPRGWIIIDEAHNYLPNRGFVASKEPLKKYVNEGRNLGLSIVVATQQPSGLDQSIQRNSDIIIVHSMSMSDDIQTVERMLNTYLPESVTVDNKKKISSRVFEQMIRSLDLGYAIVSNDRVGRIFPVKVRPRTTIHGVLKY